MKLRCSTLRRAGGAPWGIAPRLNPPLTALDTIGWDTAFALGSDLVDSGADEAAAEVLAGMLGGLDPATAPPIRVRSIAAIQTGCHQHDLAAQTRALTAPGNVRGDLHNDAGYLHLLMGWKREPVEHATTWHPGQVCGHPSCPVPTPVPQSSPQPAAAVVPPRREAAPS